MDPSCAAAIVRLGGVGVNVVALGLRLKVSPLLLR